MQEIRQEKMNQLIQTEEVVTMKALQAHFPEVSLMTIHRDLDTLAAAGHIAKIRGGARSIRQGRDPAFQIREQENLAGKALVAEKAAKLIQRGACIFLDAGTTSLALARILPDINVTIVTSGPNIALGLCHLAKPAVTLCPGNLNKENFAVSGHSTLAFLESINIDLALIGVSGYSPAEGFTCGKESEMMVKRQAIAKARRTAVLCDQTKGSRIMPYTFARLEDVDYMISDDNLSEDLLQKAKAVGVSVL